MEIKLAKLILVAAHLLFTSGPTSMIAVVVGFRSTADESTVGDVVGCRCVPDQWEGLLVSVEREFEAHDGSHPRSVETRVSVHYDFVNERFAMRDLDSGRRTVANYKQGFKYVIHNNRCLRIQTEDSMTKMCLPDEAELMGDFLLGTDVAVGMWHYTNEFNVSTRTTVMKKNCVPISEEIFMIKRVYSTLMSTQYIDVTLGIQDEAVFVAPPICKRPARILSIADSDLERRRQAVQANEEMVVKRPSSRIPSSFARFVNSQIKA